MRGGVGDGGKECEAAVAVEEGDEGSGRPGRGLRHPHWAAAEAC